MNFFGYKDLRNAKDSPDDCEPAGQGGIQVEYSSYKSCSQSTGTVTNDYVYKLGSVKLLSNNLEYSTIWHLSHPVQVTLTGFSCTE